MISHVFFIDFKIFFTWKYIKIKKKLKNTSAPLKKNMVILRKQKKGEIGTVWEKTVSLKMWLVQFEEQLQVKGPK